MKVTITGKSAVNDRIVYGMIVRDAQERIKRAYGETEPDLLAGGSSGAEHACISLFLEGGVNKLQFYLGADYDLKKGQFVPDPVGSQFNFRHDNFGGVVDNTTMTGISRCWARGAKFEVVKQTPRRAALLADCDLLLVYDDPPVSGFPRMVWNRCYGKKKFITLESLRLKLARLEGKLEPHASAVQEPQTSL